MTDLGKVLLPRVAVLIPTYQGENFLEIQLDSILGQRDVTTDIYICDDGSTDGTFQLLMKINSKCRFAAIIQTDRIGSTAAFFHLLNLVKGADFVAFCDQDDIWMPNKLVSSIKKLNKDQSELVFSRRDYIDEFGRVTGSSPRVKRNPTWANAAVQNLAFGNTQVLSKKGFDLVRQIGSVEVIHFDSWVFLLIASTYRISYIDEVLVQYRLHAKNQIGLRKVRDFLYFRKRLAQYEKQVNILLNVAGEIITQDAKMGLSRFHYRSFKIGELFSRKSDIVFRQSLLETFLMRLLLCIPTYSLKSICSKGTERP